MTRRLRLALVVSGLGHVVHNVEEFGATPFAAGQSVLPLGITALLLWAVRSPSRRVLAWTAGWGLIVLVLGGGSVLPLPVLPFEPAQTASHYGAHLAYAALQLPLLTVVRQAWGVTDPEAVGEAAA